MLVATYDYQLFKDNDIMKVVQHVNAHAIIPCSVEKEK